MHVSGIQPVTVNIGQGRKLARAIVTIVDDLGDPVAGASVTESFTGPIDETHTEVTDASGVAVLTTVGWKKGKLKFTFCVDSVSASLPYEAADNVETCGSN